MYIIRFRKNMLFLLLTILLTFLFKCAPSIGFDENGKIDEVEEAKALVVKSTPAIGILCKDGVLLAVENSVRNPLHIKKPLSRIFKVDHCIGMVVVGNLPDGLALLDKAKENARSYHQSTKQHILLEELVENLGEYLHNYTNNAFVRPFGVSVILCGWDEENGYQLYKLEPCGDFYSYFACVAGKSELLDFEKEMQEFDPETMAVSSAVIKAKEMIRKQSRDYPVYRSMELCILEKGLNSIFCMSLYELPIQHDCEKINFLKHMYTFISYTYT